MTRPSKDATAQDDRLMWALHLEGHGLRRISQAVSAQRGAFQASIVGRERRRREVSKDWVRRAIDRLKKEASQNPGGMPNAVHRLKTRALLDERSTVDQTGDS